MIEGAQRRDAWVVEGREMKPESLLTPASWPLAVLAVDPLPRRRSENPRLAIAPWAHASDSRQICMQHRSGQALGCEPLLQSPPALGTLPLRTMGRGRRPLADHAQRGRRRAERMRAGWVGVGRLGGWHVDVVRGPGAKHTEDEAYFGGDGVQVFLCRRQRPPTPHRLRIGHKSTGHGPRCVRQACESHPHVS